MTDKPILFSAPMVKALLDGRKTQTRRVIKPEPDGDVIHFGWSRETGASWTDQSFTSHRLPYWAGDRLWVREEWSGAHAFRDTPPAQRQSYTTPDGPVLREDVWFWANGEPEGGDYEKPRPSIHMPRWASRLTLIVSDVRVQRLQEISEEDAQAEGADEEAARQIMSAEECAMLATAHILAPQSMNRLIFKVLWDRINGDGAWEANPWIVAVTFRVIKQNIDAIEQETDHER